METGASFLAIADESILVEILLRLPLKSICRFRCVSKEWDGLTKTSYFLDRHRLHSSRRLLLISSSSLAAGKSNKKGVGISLLADEETAVSSLSVPFLPNDARWGLEFVGSSNGLLCCVTLLKGTRIATVVWNPATDQFNYFPIGLEKRVENATYYRLIVGFDFMHSISAYKLVTVHPYVNPINDPKQLTFQARMFNPNRNSWRVVEPELELTSCRRFNTHSITVNGVLYWLVEKQTAGVALVSFSLHDEAFKDTWKPLPGEIVRYLTKGILLEMQLIRWKNSVAVVGYLPVQEGDQFVMWVDTTTDQETNTCSWIQQIRIRWPSSLFHIGVWKDQHVFTKNGDEAGADNDEPGNLFMYDPITQTLRKVHGERNVYFHSVVGYAESNVQLE